MYMQMLDKLMSYSQEHHEYEAGEGYGSTILRYDRASERTYRRLMYLQYIAGDRTGALRQYERCVIALAEELGVKPEKTNQVPLRRYSSGRKRENWHQEMVSPLRCRPRRCLKFLVDLSNSRWPWQRYKNVSSATSSPSNKD